jgi:P-type Cu+ transporter
MTSYKHLLSLWPTVRNIARADLLNWLFLLLAAPVQFYSGRDFYMHAWKALKARTANMDTLIALGSSAAFFYSLGLLAFNLSGHVHFEAVALIIVLILVGKYLEARAKSHTGAAIKALMGLQAKTARVLRGSVEAEAPLSELRVGEIVVRPGEKVPVDGIIYKRHGRHGDWCNAQSHRQLPVPRHAHR